jgi:hypothetical protein
MSKNKIYEVTWRDAHFNPEAFHQPEIEHNTQPYVVKSVGYYVGESKIDFKIAQEIHLNDYRCGHIMSIPHKMIIRKKLLNAKKRTRI